jgi:hypothetical protein
MLPHFDGTVTLGNLLELIGLLVFGLLAWRDMNWRMKIQEEFKAAQLVINLKRDDQLVQQEKDLSLVREAIVQLTAMNQGQDRRLILLENRQYR